MTSNVKQPKSSTLSMTFRAGVDFPQIKIDNYAHLNPVKIQQGIHHAVREFWLQVNAKQADGNVARAEQLKDRRKDAIDPLATKLRNASEYSGRLVNESLEIEMTEN